MQENGKVPSAIVTLVVDKVASFTKEIEVLRAQLPKKEDISKLHGKIDKFLWTIKLLFGVAMAIVILSFLGARIIDYTRQERIEARQEQAYTKKEMDSKFKELLKKVEGLHK